MLHINNQLTSGLVNKLKTGGNAEGGHLKSLFTGAMVLLFGLLSACTEESLQFAGGGSAGKTQAERKLEAEARSLNQISRNIIVKNTIEGAVIGAAAGCGIAVILGGDSSDCLTGAAIGGVAGGVGGNAVGRQAAQKNEQIVKTAEVVKNLSQVSQRLNGVEAQLASVVRSQNSEIRSLKRQLDANQVSQSTYNARVRAINSNRTAVRNELAKSEANVDKASKQLASARAGGQSDVRAAQRAASSSKARLARTRNSIKLIDA